MRAEELIREVDEELQQEKLLGLWRRYGAYVMVAALAIVLGVTGWFGWRHWQARQQTAAALSFAAAETLLTGNDKAAAGAAFSELAQSAPAGVAALARLRAASADLQAGDPAGAIQSLEALAALSGTDPLLDQLATLTSVMLQLDTGDPARLQSRLAPLAAVGQPWRYQAQELQALLAIRANDAARGREILDSLANDASTPTNLRRRAAELRNALPQPVPGS